MLLLLTVGQFIAQPSSTTTSSLLAFFICHLIIAALLLSVAVSAPDRRPTVEENCGFESINIYSLEEGNRYVENDEEEDVPTAIRVDDDDDDNDDDEELQKKAEEFIEKMNRAWRAENGALRLRGAPPCYNQTA